MSLKGLLLNTELCLPVLFYLNYVEVYLTLYVALLLRMVFFF